MASQLQSIRELKPLNKGGVVARSGFSFQDHIAVSFCLEMATNPDLAEVWCETHDDITLIWCKDSVTEVEFVQVKDLGLDQLWSVAKLCERDGVRGGTSILERSLEEERCLEPCRFRIVTSLGVKNELEILTMPFLSPERLRNPARQQALADQIEIKLKKIISPKGNSVANWVTKTQWQIEHSSEAVQNKNYKSLSKLIFKTGHENISIDQVEESIYPQLLQLVRSAAEMDPDIDLEPKRIHRDIFISHVQNILNDLIQARKVTAGKKLIKKMEDAGLSDYVETALEQRRLYRKEKLDPQYLELSDFDLIDGETLSVLQTLRLKMDSDELEGGREFYKICLENLDSLRKNISSKANVPSYYFHGCMHDITDRCSHRYIKEQP